jgi:cell division protein FtsL
VKKINLLLVALLMFSCFKLVGVSHEARQLFSAVDRAERQQKQLDAEFRRLDAERQTQATNQKVERVARQRLHMTAPALTLYLDAPAPVAAVTGLGQTAQPLRPAQLAQTAVTAPAGSAQGSAR